MSFPSTATLEVDLSAIRANYRLLKDRHAKKSVAAVVKADAYGLGVEAVSKALREEGCREFFVATLEEGIVLRTVLPDATIGVFNGLLAGGEKEYAQHRLTPVLNDLRQMERFARGLGIGDWGFGIIHVDTGMTRLGVSENHLKKFLTQSPPPNPQSLTLMSHLACANDPAHPKNAEQLERFKKAVALLPGVRTSLCNSAGIFLPPDFHYDLARPGCALYGISPADGENPMRPVARLSAPILQVRTLERDEDIGYGATCRARKGSRMAVIALGYADGWFRCLSNKGFAYVAGRKVPIAGRVSMDMLILDISSVPETTLAPDTRAEFINKEQTVDDVAAACGTIGYEIFTRIGQRVRRVYRPL